MANEQKQGKCVPSEADVHAAQMMYRERVGQVCKAVKEIMGVTPFTMIFLTDPNDPTKGTLSVGNVPPPMQHTLIRSVMASYGEQLQGPSVMEVVSTDTGKSLTPLISCDAAGVPKAKNQA